MNESQCESTDHAAGEQGTDANADTRQPTIVVGQRQVDHDQNVNHHRHKHRDGARRRFPRPHGRLYFLHCRLQLANSILVPFRH